MIELSKFENNYMNSVESAWEVVVLLLVLLQQLHLGFADC